MVIVLLKDFILYLLFTDRCKYCGDIIKYNEKICPDCKANLPKISGEKCKACGVEKSRCSCKNAKNRYDGITAPFYYEDCIEKSIKNFKFNDKFYISKALAKDIATSVNTDFGDISFDFIDFVPFSKKQNRKRAYNPAELIAKDVSKILKIPVNNVLTKDFETEIQHISGEISRHGNVAGAYGIKENADVKGKTILLIDDIKTTGSTLNECVRVLKIAGAKEVYCAVVALTALKEDT